MDRVEFRETIVARLQQDLIGPSGGSEETIEDRPSDRYLTGILFPRRTKVADEDDTELAVESKDVEGSGSDQSVALRHSLRPASAGVSFAAEGEAGGRVQVLVRVSCGTYRRREIVVEEEDSAPRVQYVWDRRDHTVDLDPLDIGPDESFPVRIPDDEDLRDLELHVRSTPWEDRTLVTIALLNGSELREGTTRQDMEEGSFFQTSLEVRPGPETRLVARPASRPVEDYDSRAAMLLYRNARQFATGHRCSAEWNRNKAGDTASLIRTSWTPQTVVPATSSEGHAVFQPLRSREEASPFSARWLERATTEKLLTGLKDFIDAYSTWIEQLQPAADLDDPVLLAQARAHLDECGRARDRMEEAVAGILAKDPQARLAFRLANRAMAIQWNWGHPKEDDLAWRPFQLGFLLLCIPSIADLDGGETPHPDRDIMDLLWFPTGGGKTEAYLGLIAFTLFLRRLRASSTPDGADLGAGVGALMRYTLRLLTTQQFQRACAVIMACEYVRRNGVSRDGERVNLGTVPLSLGLWVGDDAVANRFGDAAESLATSDINTPNQLEKCPACHAKLTWSADRSAQSIRVHCLNSDCEFAKTGQSVPIWTVDDDVYRERPSLIIGTIDKFAQIVRNPNTSTLFNIGTANPPPSLILQDELHLISGPLGTLAAVYESTIDLLCRESSDRRVKIIGSTATIRRASEQIRALFDREGCVFPPPGIDADDSGFAVRDQKSPGRIYAGITTAGRSAKFTLQAAAASLLQSGSAIEGEDTVRDPYWTLVTYFNSLRELGGALVLMRDDVNASISEIRERRKEGARPVNRVAELTSRVSQLEIRNMLAELEESVGAGKPVDALLATNMISVGVDIPRLGLMVVNGQPKGMAEYIQATSRVGRGKLPGLIVTLYNDAKARDRSHYEDFLTWHQSLYSEVEATSVTPFAARARDRAIHAALAAWVRHATPAMRDDPTLTDNGERAARRFLEHLLERCSRIDERELPSLEEQVERILEQWQANSGRTYWWNDWKSGDSLLISAERAAALKASRRLTGGAFETPNSMRNVDPGTQFVLVEKLRMRDGENAKE